MRISLRTSFLTLGLISFALLAGACSSPTTGTTTTVQTTGVTLRSLPADFFTRKAVAYEGYRTSSGPGTGANVPTAANIDQDLTILKASGYTLLRLFSSNTDGQAALILQEIQNLGYDMKVQLGVWISGPKATSDTANQVEVNEGIKLANQYPSIVEAVSIGNETMVSWGLKVPVADMVSYIQEVRNAIKQPVTTDDNWAFYADSSGSTNSGAGSGSYATDLILAQIDYISMHTYAFSDAQYNLWDWKQTSQSDVPGTNTASPRATAMMAAAFADTQANFAAVQSYASSQGYGKLPIIIGETGWKAVATNSSAAAEPSMAHPVNQAMYLSSLASWTNGPKNIFYFEAFDEPWKGGDDGWGLFDVNRYARYALYSTITAASTQTVTNNGASETITIPGNESMPPANLSYTPANALCYTTSVTNPQITTPTYLVYADTMATSTTVSVPSPGTAWYAWNNPATATGSEKTASGTATAYEGTKYYEIQPTPSVNSPAWGWGWFITLVNSSLQAKYADNLSSFATGHLDFAIRTTYAGKIRVGFSTGFASENTQTDNYLTIDPTNNPYGYVNDGAWHYVSLPIATIAQNSAPSYGMPTTAKLNLGQVPQPFVINDAYAVTGNSASTNTTPNPVIDVDDISWTQN